MERGIVKSRNASVAEGCSVASQKQWRPLWFGSLDSLNYLEKYLRWNYPPYFSIIQIKQLHGALQCPKQYYYCKH